MSTFALVVLGVGACIGVATALLIRPDEPATFSAPPVRAPRRDRPRRAAPAGADPAAGGETGPAAGTEPEAAEAVLAGVGAAGGGRPPTTAALRARPRRPARPARPPEGEPNLPTPWFVRARAVVELLVISVLLGMAAAAAVGLAVVALFGLLRGAVG